MKNPYQEIVPTRMKSFKFQEKRNVDHTHRVHFPLILLILLIMLILLPPKS